MTKNSRAQIPNLAIVVTTFCRQDLLEELLCSISDLELRPGMVIVVDNENSQKTKDLVDSHQSTSYVPMEENMGGAGGFSRGIDEAYRGGYDWIWVMDDDVRVLPGALEGLEKWMKKTEDDLAAGKNLAETVTVYQGLRKNFDDTFFYWQYHFLEKLGIPNPIAPSSFKNGEQSRPMNTACFEGSLFHRAIIEEIGLPDARFFIYWDDILYGYLASKCTKMLLVTDYVLQRMRALENMKIGKVRKLNSTSDMARYYIMRNRGHIAQYLRMQGDYNRIIFGLGTFLTFSKEFIRLFITKSFKTGMPCLVSGWQDSRKIMKDPDWKPYAEVLPLTADR